MESFSFCTKEKIFKSAFEINTDFKNANKLLSNSNIISFLLFFNKDLFSIKKEVFHDMICDEIHIKDLFIETKQIQTKIVKEEFLDKYFFDFNKFVDEDQYNNNQLTFQKNLENFNASNNVYYCLEKLKHNRNGIEMKINLSVVNITEDNGQISDEFINFNSNSSNASNNSTNGNQIECQEQVKNDKEIGVDEDNFKNNNKSEEIIISLKLLKIDDNNSLLNVQIDSIYFINYINICKKLYQNTLINSVEKIPFSNISIFENLHLHVSNEVVDSIIVKMKEKELLDFIMNKYSLKSFSNIIVSKEYEKINLNEDDSICFDFLASFEDKNNEPIWSNQSNNSNIINQNNNINHIMLHSKKQNSNYENQLSIKLDKIKDFRKFFLCFNLKRIGLSFTLLKMTVELDCDFKNQVLLKQIHLWNSLILLDISKLTLV